MPFHHIWFYVGYLAATKAAQELGFPTYTEMAMAFEAVARKREAG